MKLPGTVMGCSFCCCCWGCVKSFWWACICIWRLISFRLRICSRSFFWASKPDCSSASYAASWQWKFKTSHLFSDWNYMCFGSSVLL